MIWFFWIEAEPIGLWVMDVVTSGLPPTHWLRLHLLESAAHTRLMTMGVILLLVLRFHRWINPWVAPLAEGCSPYCYMKNRCFYRMICPKHEDIFTSPTARMLDKFQPAKADPILGLGKLFKPVSATVKLTLALAFTRMPAAMRQSYGR